MADPSEKSDRGSGDAKSWGGGMALGLILGVGIGVAMDDIAIGVAVGIALGAAFGAGHSQTSNKQSKSGPDAKSGSSEETSQ